MIGEKLICKSNKGKWLLKFHKKCVYDNPFLEYLLFLRSILRLEQ